MRAGAEGTLGPCQVCNELKPKFYLCSRNHSTCEECTNLKEKTVSRPTAEPFPVPRKKRVTFSLPSAPDPPPTSPQRSPRSCSKSLALAPAFSTADGDTGNVGKSSGPADRDSALLFRENEDSSLDQSIFCRACNDVVEATLVTVPVKLLKSLMTQRKEDIEGDPDAKEVEDYFFNASPATPTTSVELFDDESLRQDVDNLRVGLATAYSELMVTRETLDEVMYTTEKLEMDVDMLRGGVNYVYFNFDSVLKQKEVRAVEKICGIPFVLMVRMRLVARTPHLGFFIGLETSQGHAHSPLKKNIVLRAHNAYGKVIEKHAFNTFEDGMCVHPCFDLTKRSADCGMWGYANFLKKDRILKPDMLKDGRLCLSLQIKPLS